MTLLAPPPQRSRLQSVVGGLPRAFWWLWAGTLVNRLGLVVQPFLILYLTGARGLSPGAAGLIVALYGLGSLVSQPVGGMMTDAYGRRRTMVGGLLADAVALLALGAAGSLQLIALCAFVVGVVGDVYRPASAALIADIVPSKDRPRAYSLQYWAVNLGFSVATISAGLMIAHGYALLFFVDAGTAAVFAVLVLRGIHDAPRANVGTQVGRSESPAGIRQVLRDRLLLGLMAVSTVTGLVYVQAYATLPLAVRGSGLSASAYGFALAVNGVGIIVIQPLVLPMIARRDRGRVLAVAQLILCVGMATTALCATTVEYAGAVFLWTLGEIGVGGLFTSLIADLAPPSLRGRYLGVFGLTYGIAATAGPAIGTTVFQRLGANVLWAACAVVGGLAAAGQVALNRAVRERLSADELDT